MLRIILFLVYTYVGSITVCAAEPKFLPVFDGESDELGKVTLMSTVHYERDPYSFDQEVFD